MNEPSWLIDKSALVRLGTSSHAEQWAESARPRAHRRRDTGRGRILRTLCPGYGPRLRTPPLSSMPVEYSTPTIEDRAMTVQRQLAERGQHRAPSIPDLLIAATAELSNRIVLHVDKDFELIADLTSQPIERLRTERSRTARSRTRRHRVRCFPWVHFALSARKRTFHLE
jgi:hypothetical protein